MREDGDGAGSFWCDGRGTAWRKIGGWRHLRWMNARHSIGGAKVVEMGQQQRGSFFPSCRGVF
jgi:hypothetical protein